MKREIKFRAWHKEEKKLCQIDVLTTHGAFLIGVNNGPDELINGSKMIIISPKNGRFCMNEDIELMQFTGLHDKNGKEIYEGDILKLQYPINYGFAGIHDEEIIVTISFEDGCYWFSGCGYTDCNWHFYSNYEVIGNIFENEELIQKS